MKARIARLESDVTHLLGDESRIELDLRGLRVRASRAGIPGAMARGFEWL